MNRAVKMSYETMGSSSYMTMTCPAGVELVNYRMEMLLSNEIKNFLSVSRQMLDGETVIYYNITSKIPLKQILDKRKLNRKELFRLIEGAISASKEGAAYRLPDSGIVLEPEYIYVNPATCSPAFMYIPLPETEGQGIRELLSMLVLHDGIELSNDNFIQVLLMELNRQPFSLQQLEQSLKPYKTAEPGVQPQVWREPVSQPAAPPVGNRQALHYQQESSRELNQQISSPQQTNHHQSDPVSDDKKEKAEVQTGFDPEKAKKKFMLPQALIMVLIAASVSFGLFTDESGKIVLNNIMAFAIVLALAEVILYREIYVNSKAKSSKSKAKNSKSKASESRKNAARPQLPSQREFPGREPVQPVDAQPIPITPPPMPPRSVNLQQPQRPINAQPTPNVGFSQPPIQPYPLPRVSENMDSEGETELWGGEGGEGAPAYLEYYDEGRLSRIPLNSLEGIVIGRLKEQVDFAVKSPRVGKVHARFFSQGGQHWVVDINSKNGTYVNGSGARIESNIPYPLCDKDRIMLADCEFTIRCQES